VARDVLHGGRIDLGGQPVYVSVSAQAPISEIASARQGGREQQPVVTQEFVHGSHVAESPPTGVEILLSRDVEAGR